MRPFQDLVIQPIYMLIRVQFMGDVGRKTLYCKLKTHPGVLLSQGGPLLRRSTPHAPNHPPVHGLLLLLVLLLLLQCTLQLHLDCLGQPVLHHHCTIITSSHCIAYTRKQKKSLKNFVMACHNPPVKDIILAFNFNQQHPLLLTPSPFLFLLASYSYPLSYSFLSLLLPLSFSPPSSLLPTSLPSSLFHPMASYLFLRIQSGGLLEILYSCIQFTLYCKHLQQTHISKYITRVWQYELRLLKTPHAHIASGYGRCLQDIKYSSRIRQ